MTETNDIGLPWYWFNYWISPCSQISEKLFSKIKASESVKLYWETVSSLNAWASELWYLVGRLCSSRAYRTKINKNSERKKKNEEQCRRGTLTVIWWTTPSTSFNSIRPRRSSRWPNSSTTARMAPTSDAQQAAGVSFLSISIN